MREGDQDDCAPRCRIPARRGTAPRERSARSPKARKGLVAFAKLSLEAPGLLILDEPTNHINFRHIPVIAKALDRYEGAMILVSHVRTS